MPRHGTLLKDLSPEDYPWITRTIHKGTIVHKFYGQTFGSISDEGVACTLEPDRNPFFEIPKQLIEWNE